MTDEHFGIGVVEYMVTHLLPIHFLDSHSIAFQAAGLIPVAHNSAGPKQDIVVDFQGSKTGYLAKTADEYCKAIHDILAMTPQKRRQTQESARKSVLCQFSDHTFIKVLGECLDKVFKS
jgi:alpha-1,2-mannosyltransferase